MEHKLLVGQFWSTYFSLKENEVKELIEHVDLLNDNYVLDLSQIVSEFYDRYRREDQDIQRIVCKSIFDWCLNSSDFAESVLEKNEYEKACNLFKRKQYVGVLNKLLKIFYSVINYTKLIDKMKLILSISIVNGVAELENEIIEKNFSLLKNKIIEIASGVKNECYLKRNTNLRIVNFNEQIADYIKKKYNYNVNTNCYGCYFDYNTSATIFLRKFLIEDEDFWKNNCNFNIIAFINNVTEFNSFKQACKIVDYIFEKIQAHEYYNVIVENNLPLTILSRESLINLIEKRVKNYTFGRFECDELRPLTANEMSYFSYPIKDEHSIDTEIFEGKKVFNDFIKFSYPDNSNEVIEIFSKPNAMIFEKTAYGNSIAEYVDNGLIDFNGRNMHRILLEKVHAKFFADENVLSRMYLKCFLFKKIFGSETNNKLYQLFFDIFKNIEVIYGIKTTLQLDTSLRERKYKSLCNILKSYEIDIRNSKYKNDYIVAILDRRFATIEEAEKFPALEQYGDAIWDLAISEIIFYDYRNYSNEEDQQLVKSTEELKNAGYQSQVSKKTGLSDTYIVSSKEFIDKEEKCLADSLEMIVAVIAKEFGIESSIKFIQNILLQVDKRLIAPLKEKDAIKRFDLSREKGVSEDYWIKIYPAPYSSIFDNDYSYISRALDKVLLCEFLGTHSKECRNLITRSLGSFGHICNYADHTAVVSPVLYDYLHCGIKYVIKKYRNKIQ